jgi:hypothetical protein
MKQIATGTEVQESVAAVFENTARAVGPAILGALVPHCLEPIRMIHFFPEYEADELCRFVNQLNDYMRGSEDPRGRTRLRTLIYCQVMEAELPPAIVWNLLRLLRGKSPSWTFYTVTSKGKELACDEPEKRIDEIEGLAVAAGLPVGGVLRKLWHRRLRNAFSHGQYITSERGDFVGGKNISPLTATAVRPSDNDDGTGENPYYYRSEEVEALYGAALEWLGAVSDCYKIALRPFKDGAFHDVPTGPIRWDQERRLWATS